MHQRRRRPTQVLMLIALALEIQMPTEAELTRVRSLGASQNVETKSSEKYRSRHIGNSGSASGGGTWVVEMVVVVVITAAVQAVEARLQVEAHRTRVQRRLYLTGVNRQKPRDTARDTMHVTQCSC